VWGENGGTSARQPALDGLRGVAVAGVLLFHAGFGWAAGGFLGVSIFFTLSGFLITSLLLAERDSTGRISLGHFWSRRARRILPAALIALAGIALYGLTVADAHQAARLPGDGLSALAEVANWRFVLGDQSYAALFSAPSPVQHFWSLAIEEQFYVVFPLLLVGMTLWTRRSRRSLTILVASLAVGSAVLAALLFSPGHDPSRVYYGTDTRAVELLVGALLAIALTGRRRLEGPKVQIAVAIGGVLALVALIAAWVVVAQSDDFLYRGGLPLHAVLVALVIAAVLVPGPVRRVLALKPLAALGLISYGVYLYHWPIFLWLSPERTGLDGAALFGERIALTLAIAVGSYFWIEQPIRHGRRITGWRPALIAPAVAAGVALLFVSVPSATSSPKLVFSAVHAPAAAIASAPHAGAATTSATPVTLPVTGPGTPPAPGASALAGYPGPPVHRILLVGDSVAQTLGRGLERWGPQHGVRVVNAARFYCGIARGGRLAMTLGHDQSTCGDWSRQWPPLLDRFHPDLVVVLSTIWDVGGRQRAEWGSGYVDQGDPRFDQFIEGEWRQAETLLASRGARVVWLTDPCAANAALSGRLRRANDTYLPALRRTTGVVTVDLAAHVCPGGQFTDQLGPVADGRPDGLHFSDPGADWVAQWLGPALTDRALISPVAVPADAISP
jgi:peptidoglycan/LPS O-acetylase OafA/YrhL